MRQRSSWQRALGLAVVFASLVVSLVACAAPSQFPGVTSSQKPESPDTLPSGLLCLSCSAYTPQQMRAAYGLTSLYDAGKRGQGQTVVIVDSFGSPTLAQDLAAFDAQYNLPAVKLQTFTPLGVAQPGSADPTDVSGWQIETTLDVEMVHAIAPEASIALMISPVDETEGVQGLPEFRQLEQYAIDHHLGTIFSQSWAASETSLSDAAGRAEIAQWESFYQQIVTKQRITILSATGDHGATDLIDFSNGANSPVSPTPIVNYPASSSWVTAVGGTTLLHDSFGFSESVWNSGSGASGGGASQFIPLPAFQQSLPANDQSILHGQRGIPDVAAAADSSTGMPIYVSGQWHIVGGTSAAAPLWAGVMAVADQVAGKPLGAIDPALYKIAASPQYASAFRDVTQGDNTYSQGAVRVQGYSATQGWDAATGLGAPNAANLIPLLIQDSHG